MKMTVSQQLSDEAYQRKYSKKHHNGTRIKEQLSSSPRQNLPRKIDIVNDQKPFSMNLKKLKNKYMLLESSYDSSFEKSSANAAKSPEDKPENMNDGIPLPKYVLFRNDEIEQSWKTCMQAGAGLVNLGNTCFLNSALQCLTYTPPLANYLLYADHKNHCKNNGQFCMLCALQHHINNALNNSGQSIKPLGVLKNLRFIAKHMHFGKQEDAHEFIRYSIDAMQKSCLSGYSNKLDMHTKATTLVHRVFGGYLRSRVKCRQCKAVSDTFDPFLDISLDINRQGCSDLRRCFEHFITAEVLQGEDSYKCHRCKNAVSASKAFSIHRPPNILTVQLKRFSSYMGSKIKKDVTYPCKLNLGPYTSSFHKDGPWYELYAVLVHSGFSCQSGHYYAYAKAANGQWHCFNDSTVHQVGAHQVLSEQAYLLFYHKVAKSKKVAMLNKATASSITREPILHVLNKEMSRKSSNNGLKVSSNSLQKDNRVKLHTSSQHVKPCSGNSYSTKQEIEKDQNLFSKFSLITKTDNMKKHGVNQKPVCAPSAGPSKCPYPSVGSLKKSSDFKSTSNTGPVVSKNIPNRISSNSESKSSNSLEDIEKKKSTPSPAYENCVISKISNSFPRGGICTNTTWLQKKLREKRMSFGGNSHKSQNQSKSLISFKVKSFSKLNQEQKDVHKGHQPKSTAIDSLTSIRKAYSRQDDESSSSDSCYSEKEVAIERSKILGKHKPAQYNSSNAEEKGACFNSPSKKRKVQTIADNCTKPKAGCYFSSTVRKQNGKPRNKEPKEHSNILSELIEQSSIKTYGGNPSPWDDKDSIDNEGAKESCSRIGCDKDCDHDRSKAVKSKFQTNQYNNATTNLFQKFQKYDPRHSPN